MNYRRAYEQWTRLVRDDPEAVRELQSIAGDEKQIEDRFYTELTFGTAGMRGVLGMGTNRMNRYTVRRAACGLGAYVLASGGAQRGVAIAYDSRRMSPELARETALALAGCGVRAWLFPSLRPVPVLSFAVRHLGAIAGVAITASHNPPQYNGFKVYWEDGAQIPPERADQVLAAIRGRPYESCRPMDEAQARERGLLVTVGDEVDDAYVAHVKTLSVRPELFRAHGGELTIVYTPLHGSGNIPVRRVLGEMGVDRLLVVPEQEAPDGAFPTVEAPNPEDPGAFRLAIALARQGGADACFATDPDADRLGVATRRPDGSFAVLTGNQIGCLLLDYILSARAERGELPRDGVVVKSVVSATLAEDIAKAHGVRCVDTLTGFKFIAGVVERLERSGEGAFLFGFEESYGYLSSTYVRDKDAVNASLLVTELALSLKLRGKTLWDRLEELYGTYGYQVDRVRSIALPGKDGLARMGGIMEGLRRNPPRDIGGVGVAAVRDYAVGLRTSADGARPMGLPLSDMLYYELEGGGWVCARPSGTEPKMKLYASARGKTREAAEALADQIDEGMKRMIL